MKILHWLAATAFALASAAVPAASTILGTLSMPAGDYASFVVDPVLHRAYSVNVTTGRLVAVDTDALQIVGTVAVDAGATRVRVDAAHHRVYVMHNSSPGLLTIVDGKSMAVVAKATLADKPLDLAVDFQRGEIYLIHDEAGHHFTIFDTKTNAVASTLQFAQYVYGITLDRAAGKIYVPQFGSKQVAVISQASRAIVKNIPVSMYPVGAIAEERNGSVFVSGFASLTATAVDQVAVLDTATDTVRNGVCCMSLSQQNVGRFDPMPSPVYGRAYFSNPQQGRVTVTDARDGNSAKQIPIAGTPIVRLINADDGEVYVVDWDSEAITVLDARLERIAGTLNVGLAAPVMARVGSRVLLFGDDAAGNTKIVAVTPYGLQSITAIATDFYHPGFDHYFHTASGEETRALQDGIFGQDWVATQQVWRVFDTPGAGRVPVCRFFSTGFGAKSSHFYTPYATECEDLKKGTTWTYEETSYYVVVPTAEGTCIAGLAELYRLYNNGMGGAPNHAYTDSRAKRDELQAKGWIPEGTGPQTVFACIPPAAGWLTGAV